MFTRYHRGLLAIVGAAAIGFGAATAASAARSGSYEGDERVFPDLATPDQIPDQGADLASPFFSAPYGPSCADIRASPGWYGPDQVAACGPGARSRHHGRRSSSQ